MGLLSILSELPFDVGAIFFSQVTETFFRIVLALTVSLICFVMKDYAGF
jgi:hypothetical protein